MKAKETAIVSMMELVPEKNYVLKKELEMIGILTRIVLAISYLGGDLRGKSRFDFRERFIGGNPFLKTDK
jgi:hypothetical protein